MKTGWGQTAYLYIKSMLACLGNISFWGRKISCGDPSVLGMSARYGEDENVTGGNARYDQIHPFFKKENLPGSFLVRDDYM